VTTGLERVAQKARSDKTTRLTSLAHHLTKERLLKNLRSIQTSSGVGVDGESKEEALKTFESWSADILSQVHKRAYRPPPVRRVLIPKPGKVDKRPIGVPTIRERVLQKSTAQILESIYETDFLPTSFGGRPKKSAHSALGFLSDKIANGKVSWVYEADLKNFFGSLNHGWMKKFVELRVGDPRILTLIQRWLKAGVMVEGRYEESSEGTPQGGSISVVLSNVYLHYVLDIWFERVVKPRMKGEAYLCRYLDDFIVCFQFKADANRFSRVLRPRLGKFGLSLEPTKTRLVPFGKFVERDSKEHGYRKPPTLKFLGFTLYGMRYPWGYWGVGFKPQSERLRRFMAKLKEEMRRNRHLPLAKQVRAINIRLRGFANYFGLPLTSHILKALRHWTVRYWRKVLSSRSQRGRLNWKKFNVILGHHPILNLRLRFTFENWRAFVSEQANI
jgi:group II intron reverse transcriptase/maturase